MQKAARLPCSPVDGDPDIINIRDIREKIVQFAVRDLISYVADV